MTVERPFLHAAISLHSPRYERSVSENDNFEKKKLRGSFNWFSSSANLAHFSLDLYRALLNGGWIRRSSPRNFHVNSSDSLFILSLCTMNKELEMNISMQAKNERRTEESHRSCKKWNLQIFCIDTTADDKIQLRQRWQASNTHNKTARTTLFPRFALHFSSVIHSSSRWCVYYAAQQQVRAPTTNDIAVVVNNWHLSQS